MPDTKGGAITITGLSHLEKRLGELPDKIAKSILSGAIRAGAVVIQNEARKLAPISVKPHMLGSRSKAALIEPGFLKKSIRVRRAPSRKATMPVEFWVYVSGKAWYWKFVEFGTSRMSANPFMRPAFDSMKSKALERIKEYLATRIDKEVGV